MSLRFRGGGFVVAWESDGQDGSGDGTYVRVFDNSGSATSAEILVATTTNGDQHDPRIAATSDGGFVVVLTSENVDGGGDAVIGQRFDAAGAKAGVQFTVNTTTTASQNRAEVASNPNGGFVVVWESENQDGDGRGIFSRVYDAAGSATTGEIQVNANTTSHQEHAAVVVQEDGSYAVAWTDVSAGTDTITVRLFDSAGSPLTSELTLDSDARTSSAKTIELLDDQSFVVAWNRSGYHGSGGWGSWISSAHVSADGSSISAASKLSDGTTRFYDASDAALSLNSDGSLLVTYSASGPEWDNSDIVARQIAVASVVEGSSNGAVVGTVSTVDPDSGDTFSYTLTDTAGGRFAIDSVTGVITVADGSSLDFESATSHDIVVRTTDSGSETYDEALTIHLVDVNEAPVLTVPAGQSTPAIFSVANGNAITISDVDSDTFEVIISVDQGTLTLASTANLYFNGGDGTEDAAVYFGGSFADVTAALDGLVYQSDMGGSGTATISIQAIDGGSATGDGDHASDSDTIAATIAANTAPTFTTLDGNPAFIEGGAAVVLDADVMVADAELDTFNGGSGDYDSASVTLVRNGGANSDDVYGFSDGNGITLSGSTLIKNSQVIAAFDTAATPGQLVVTFTNANGETPTSADVDFVLQQITYSNSSPTPPASVQIDWTFSDENNGAQGSAGALTDAGSTTVSITPGANDAPQFGADAGVVTTDIDGNDSASDIILQPDGKFILVGSSDGSGNQDLTLTRYSANGILDSSFGSGGIVTTTVTASNDLAASVALQSDGKILVSGGTEDGPAYDAVIARYNTDGSLDTTFGSTGVIVTDAGGYDWAHSVQVQSDGKIVTGGFSYTSDYEFLAMRHNADGTLDTSFSGDGIATFALGYSIAEELTIQSDGKILLSGYSYSSDYNLSLVRLNTDGSLDTSFDTDGILTTSLSAGPDYSYDVELQSDGKIVIAGGFSNGTDNDVLLARFNTNGSIDSSFSGDGYTTADFGQGDDEGVDLAILSDGSFVIGSIVSNGANNDFGIAKFAADGTLDTSFGSNGLQTTAVGSGDDRVLGISVQSNSKILAAGDTGNGSNTDFAVVRYNADGTLDTLFGQADALDGSPNFVEDGAAVLLDTDVNILDPELDALNNGNGNYDGASLTIARNGGANAEDALSFVDGNGITLSGNSLMKSGQIIASFDTDSTAGELVITFTDANGETPTSVDADSIMRQINYSNTSNVPPTDVQLDWTFSDGDSGTPLTATGNVTVSITANNDAPIDISSDTEQHDLADNAIAVIGSQTGTQDTSATLSNGRTVTVSVNGINIDAEVFDSFGNSLTGSYQIFLGTEHSGSGDADNPVVAALPNGGFVVVAQMRGYVGSGSYGEAIIARAFDSVGNEIELSPGLYGGSHGVLVSNSSAGNTEQITPTLDIAGNGTVTISWNNIRATQFEQRTFSILGPGVSEDAADDTVVSTLSGVDPEGDTLTYSIVGGDSNFEIVGDEIRVKAGSTLDYEINSSHTITVRATDTGALTYDEQFTIIVNDVVEAPVQSSIESGALAYTENDGAVAITASLSLSDIDDTDLESAVIQIVGNFDNTEDLLTFVDQNGISGSWNSSTGEMTLTGTATIAQYQTAIRSITYTNSSESPNTSTRTVSFTVNDGDADSNVVARYITIASVNDNPTNAGSLPSDITVTEDTASNVDLSAIDLNDVDSGASSLTVTLTTSTGGNLSAAAGTGITLGGTSTARTLTGSQTDLNNYLNTASNVTYLHGTANLNGNDADTIQVNVNDNGNTGSGGGTNIDLGTVNVDITTVNDIPVGIPTISGTVTEGQTLTAVTSGISDADGLGAFSYQWLRDGSAISGATNSTYTLGDADVGTLISVQVTYTDGNGTPEGPLVSAQTAAVVNVNDLPVGVPTITGTVTEDQVLMADTSGISDADGLGTFSYQWLRDGAAIGGATSSTYTLDDADVGTLVSVQVTYTDGNGTPEGPLVSAQTAAVANINDAPIAVSESYLISNTEILAITSPGVLANDSDVDGPALTAVLDSSPVHGSLTLNSDGSFTYIPSPSYSGLITFTYHAFDGGLGSTPVVVSINTYTSPSSPYYPDGPDDGEGIDNGGPNDKLPADESPVDEPVVTPPPSIGLPPETVTPPLHSSPSQPSSGDGVAFYRDRLSQFSEDLSFRDRNEFSDTAFLQRVQYGKPSSSSLVQEVGFKEIAPSLPEEYLSHDLDLLEYWLNTSAEVDQVHAANTSFFVGTAANILTGLSASYLAWSLRGSYLLAAMAGSLPAWTGFDPIFVIDASAADSKSADENAKEQSLADLATTGLTKVLKP